MPAPRFASATGPTTGPDFALESRLLRTYRAFLHQASQQDMEALALQVYGPLLSRATKTKAAQPLTGQRAQQALEARIELLDEVVPELLTMCRPKEQQHLALLLLDAKDVAAFARELVNLNGAGNRLYKRESDEPSLDDEALFKAAGLGGISRQETVTSRQNHQQLQRDERGHFIKGSYVPLPVGPPLTLTPPEPKPRPTLRTTRRGRRRLSGYNPFQFSLWPPVIPVSAVRVKGL